MNQQNKVVDKYGVIKLNAFDARIKWFVGNFKNFIKKYRLEKCGLEDGYLGMTFKHNGVYFIYSDGEDVYNTIPHESVHAIARMAEHRGILFDVTNHEMIAYMVGYVSGKILDSLNKE